MIQRYSCPYLIQTGTALPFLHNCRVVWFGNRNKLALICLTPRSIMMKAVHHSVLNEKPVLPPILGLHRFLGRCPLTKYDSRTSASMHPCRIHSHMFWSSAPFVAGRRHNPKQMLNPYRAGPVILRAEQCIPHRRVPYIYGPQHVGTCTWLFHVRNMVIFNRTSSNSQKQIPNERRKLSCKKKWKKK